MNVSRCALPSILALLSATPAFGNTSFFTVPDFRGQSGSAYAGWEAFTVPAGAPGNAPDLAGSSAAAKFTQADAGAFITSTGNLYVGPVGTGTYTVSYSNPEPLGLVVFQARTLGNELAYDSLRLNYASGSVASVRTELERVQFGPPIPQPGSGFSVSSHWSWDLSGLEVKDFTITFAAAAPDVSFDAATLDVRTVPEPETWALLGLGGLAAAGLRRRWNRKP